MATATFLITGLTMGGCFFPMVRTNQVRAIMIILQWRVKGFFNVKRALHRGTGNWLPFCSCSFHISLCFHTCSISTPDICKISCFIKIWNAMSTFMHYMGLTILYARSFRQYIAWEMTETFTNNSHYFSEGPKMYKSEQLWSFYSEELRALFL